MKLAKYENDIRHCLAKWDNNQYFINKIELKNIFNWKDAKLNLNSPVSIITGRNGTGKSTLVNSIKHVADLQNEISDSSVFSLLGEYGITLTNQNGQTIVIKNHEIMNNGFNLPTISDLTFDSSIYSFYRNSPKESMRTYLPTLDAFESIPLEKKFLDILRELLEKPISLCISNNR